jgi:hypothetical protein
LGPPPPFDEDDLKLAKRREKKVVHASQRGLTGAADAVGYHHKSRAVIDVGDLGPPPPFDEDDLKLAKRREKKVVHASQRGLTGTAVVGASD